MQIKHDSACDDCLAEERGLILSTDQNNDWYAFYAHDTYGDGEYKGASYQVVAGPAKSESELKSLLN